MQRKCSVCGVVKDLEEFPRANGEQRHGQCKECRNAWKRDRPAEVKRMERRSYIQRNREQHLAHKAVRKAIARGTLVRPDRCEACGVECEPHAHHDDYSLRFEVRWLCVRCHAATHMARVRVDMRLPEELVAAVDEARGDVSRTRFMERALERALAQEPLPPIGPDDELVMPDGEIATVRETPESAQRREKAAMDELRRSSAPAYRRPFNPRPKGS